MPVGAGLTAYGMFCRMAFSAFVIMASSATATVLKTWPAAEFSSSACLPEFRNRRGIIVSATGN